MVLGYVHDLVKGKSGKNEPGQARLRRMRGRRGKDVNATHDDVTANTMFINCSATFLLSLLLYLILQNALSQHIFLCPFYLTFFPKFLSFLDPIIALTTR